MSLKLFMDVHVPQAITDGLRRRGIAVLTAQEDRAAQLTDPELLDRATQLGYVLFSRDEDLLAEGALRQQTGKSFAGVIYAHQLRVSIGQCVNDLALIATVYEPGDLVNRIEHLPLR